ncbi:MAG: four helix bundle protein [Bacteroidota bacterium]
MSKESIIGRKSFDFALNIINLYKELQNSREYILSKQLLRSGTSIGANTREASAAQSRKDFISKLSIALKEARETEYWLSLLKESHMVELDYANYLIKVNELILILTSIIKTSQERKDKITQNSKLRTQN